MSWRWLTLSRSSSVARAPSTPSGAALLSPNALSPPAARWCGPCSSFCSRREKSPTGRDLAQGFPRRLELALARLARGLQAPPELLHGVGHVVHQRAGHAQRKVQPRCVQLAQRHVVLVVDDVDAAAKTHRAVDHTQLAVQAPPAAGQQQAEAAQRRVDVPVHAGGVEAVSPRLRDRWACPRRRSPAAPPRRAAPRAPAPRPR